MEAEHARWPERCRRVVFILNRYPALGGIESSVENLTVALKNRGLDVEVVSIWQGTTKSSVPVTTVFENEAVQSTSVTGGKFTGLRTIRLIPRLLYKRWTRWRSLYRLRTRLTVGGEGTLVVIAKASVADILTEAGFASRPGGPLVVGQCHGPFRDGSQFDRALGQLSGMSDALTALSTPDAIGFSRIWKIPCYRVPNMMRKLAPSEDLSETETSKPDIAVSLARYSPEKRLDIMIDCFLNATDFEPLRSWQLHIYGDGDERAKLQDIIDARGANSRVRLMGYTAHVGDVLAKASIHLITSEREGAPMAVAEAAQFGVPTLSFACSPGTEEAVAATHGVLVPIGELEQFTRELRDLLLHPAKLRERGKHTAESVRRFDEDSVVSRWAEIVQGIYETRAAASMTRAVGRRSARPR